MKVQYLLIVLLMSSCNQDTKQNKIATYKTKSVALDTVISESVTIIEDKVVSLNFNKSLSAIKTKALPLIDTTNFNNFKEENLYVKPEIIMLKLDKLYPDFFKEGYNYRAKASYRVNVSTNFHSIVITVLKGDHELESVLINYDLEGEIIDSKVISYDEIAEGAFQRNAKIEKNKITVTYIEWIEERKETIKVFKIKANGKIVPISKS